MQRPSVSRLISVLLAGGAVLGCAPGVEVPGSAGFDFDAGADGPAGTGARSGSGGSSGTGGQHSTGGGSGTGGMSNTGGNFGSGGRVVTGGNPGSGGRVATGGNPGSGGRVATGGNPGSGGRVATGGNPSSGGRIGTGGSTNLGGNPGSGGRTNVGGIGGSAGRANMGGNVGGGGNIGSTGGSSGSAGPVAGNPDGTCSIPAEAQLENVSMPRTIVGNGTAASCTSTAFVDAVARGGVITFACGPDPLTITLDRTAKIVNDTGPKIVIDGGGKVTLSGGGRVRILYQNTCDQAQKWTTSHCDDQPDPQLTVQNLTFVDGNSKGETLEGGGGGAIFVRGGRLKVINSRFFNNVCDDTGPDVGGGAVRTLSQSQGLPVHIVNSTFGGRTDLGNVCSNGGGLSSIGVSYWVTNSLFSYNRAIGNGANPMRSGTPGGGSGGAIYNDGNTYTLTLCGTKMTNNTANEGGGGIFYVSNDLSGSLIIRDSVLTMNPSAGFETAGFPGIFVLANGPPQVTSSIITR
jgi:hypothetical protein